MAEICCISKAYISALENNERNIGYNTLRAGITDLGIEMKDYLSLLELEKVLS